MEEILKNIFADKTLTYDEFVDAIATEKVKLADLSKGDYVDKMKYEKLAKKVEDAEAKYNELAANANGDDSLKKQIEDLNKALQEAQKSSGDYSAKVKELSRREIVRNAGIQGEFIDLANFKFRDIEDDAEFADKISTYAKDNAKAWASTAVSTPNLATKPAGELNGVEAALAKLDPKVYK